jgi:hypothetical protein
MIRFKNRIDIKTNRNGDHSILTDMGSYYKTTLIEHGNTRTEWWERQHHSELRGWQSDLFLGEFDRLYRRLNFAYQMQYYLVHQEGKGRSQPHDIVFAKIESANLWLLGTSKMSWAHTCDLDNFSLHPDTAILGDISSKTERLRYYEQVLEPIELHIKKKESVDA